jgi:hypothetical protein
MLNTGIVASGNVTDSGVVRGARFFVSDLA